MKTIVFILKNGESKPAQIKGEFRADGTAAVSWGDGHFAIIRKEKENIDWRYKYTN